MNLISVVFKTSQELKFGAILWVLYQQNHFWDTEQDFSQ